MKKIIFSILFILIIPSICFAQQSCYKLNNNYVAVKTKIFNDLATSKKLVEMYESQLKLLENNLNDLETLDKQKTDIYEKKIANMQMTLDAKQAIIDTQNDSIKQYKNLELIANSCKNKLIKTQRLNVWQKIFVSGIIGYAISETDSNNARIALGSLGLTNIVIQW